MMACWSVTATDSDPTDPTLADTDASIGAAALAFSATAPAIGAARLASSEILALMFNRSPSSSEPVVASVVAAGAGAAAGVGAGVVAGVGAAGVGLAVGVLASVTPAV